MATGEWIRGGGGEGPRVGPEVIFNNTLGGNYYSVTGAMQEWIDEGGLRDRNACLQDQVNGFSFEYCSSYPDPAGSSGTIVIRFYDDNGPCVTPSAWPESLCSYQLTGLPLGTATGGLQCWQLAVDLSGGFECPATLSTSLRTESSAPNGYFGWGFEPLQPDTGPIVGHGGYKVRCGNGFLWFDRIAGTYVGCYWFGCGVIEAFILKLYGSRANALLYRAQDPAWPRLLDTLQLYAVTAVAPGAAATWEVASPAPGRHYLLAVSRGAAERGVLSGRATLLVSPSAAVAPGPVTMPGGAFTGLIPALPPAELFLQAVEVSSGAVTAVSNGLRHCF